MRDKAKKILGIILAVVLALSLFIGLTIVLCCRFEWLIAALITLGSFIVSFGFGGLVVLAINLINR